MCSNKLMTAESRIQELLEQERDYHNLQNEHENKFPVAHNDTWRQMIVKWCYNVVDHIKADREVVYIAVHILDRFLKSQVIKPCSKRLYLTDRKDYEAAVITSLLITLKLHEKGTSSSSICIEEILDLSRSSVTSRDIVEVGQTLVENLQWNNQLPTAARFAHALIDMLPQSVNSETRQALFEECVFSIELSVHDQRCSSELPSLIAWMALENALTTQLIISQETRNCFRAKVSNISGLKYDPSVRRRLCNLQTHAKTHGIGVNNNTRSKVAVIPPEDEGNNNHLHSSYHVQYLNSISYNQMEKELIIADSTNTQQSVIESKAFIGNMKRCISNEECHLPRSKRFREFS